MAALDDQTPAQQGLSDAPARAPGSADPGLPFHWFIALIAAIMACNALQIDSMLPALPAIGRTLGITQENQRQWIISVYLFGFGAAQLFYGPLADRFGRRPILIVGLGLNALASLWAALAVSFHGLLIARLLQGITGAAGRVLVVSIVRDCYQGRQMARVMSLSFIVFLAVPILAPSIGQAITLVADWRAIFFTLAGFVTLVAAIGGLRLNETLHPEHRRPISIGGVSNAVRRTLTDRNAIGYALASAVAYGALTAYINSVEQIFTDTFHAPRIFPLAFAVAAGSMGIAAFINSRIVERLGTRRVSHGALIGFVLVGLVHGLVALGDGGHETILGFTLLQSLSMFCFGLIGSNFNSMAMESMGDIAGTASSVQGFISTCGGALVGLFIGQAFDGTTRPLAVGCLVIGLVVLALVLVTERGRLFRPHHAR